MIYVGLDDTDNLESRGTGRLARRIAGEIASDYAVIGVIRHQLLVDPRVPYTKHNSSATILLDAGAAVDLSALHDRVAALMLADFQEGSDPGLCVARDVPVEIMEFGRRAQTDVVTQAEARALAARHPCLLSGLGGTQDGVIGALSAVGLAASRNDGRYVLVGQARELAGLQPVSAVLAAGIDGIQTLDGHAVTSGLIHTEKLRPARRNGQAILVVEKRDDYWFPLKLN